VIVYDRDTLPEGGWREYKQRGTRWMLPATGPLVVVTKEGAYSLGGDWSGFIAVDTCGYPYPVDAEEHALTYEAVR